MKTIPRTGKFLNAVLVLLTTMVSPAVLIQPLMPDLDVSDAQKAEILNLYAPQVMLGESPHYFPSPVEFSFQHNARIWEPEGLENNWWLYSYENFDPGEVLDYFHGCDGDPCRLADVPVYAFWDQVNDVLIDEQYMNVVDLIYFLWYPYNRGKEILDTYWGNHVGDWEHVSIRLIPLGETWMPYQIFLSQHSGGDRLSWNEIGKYEGTNHPVVYSAWGSHAIYKDSGNHIYDWIPLYGPLIDVCSVGNPWNTWQFVEAYDYDNKSGLTGNAWPGWMDRDWDNPELGYTNPASGPIFKWGDREAGTCAFGQCQLVDGPTGPIYKDVWDVQTLK